MEMGPGSECSDTPERLDFREYLDLLEERGHPAKAAHSLKRGSADQTDSCRQTRTPLAGASAARS
jgi:hypothetical protein